MLLHKTPLSSFSLHSIGASPNTHLVAGLALALIATVHATHAQAQGLPTCRTDVPLVLQPSNCLPDRHAKAASMQPAPAASKPATKGLAELLRERDGDVSTPHIVSEWRLDGSKVIKARTLEIDPKSSVNAPAP